MNILANFRSSKLVSDAFVHQIFKCQLASVCKDSFHRLLGTLPIIITCSDNHCLSQGIFLSLLLLTYVPVDQLISTEFNHSLWINSLSRRIRSIYLQKTTFGLRKTYILYTALGTTKWKEKLTRSSYMMQKSTR